jgi:ribosomal protein L11 methyltransferase
MFAAKTICATVAERPRAPKAHAGASKETSRSPSLSRGVRLPTPQNPGRKAALGDLLRAPYPRRVTGPAPIQIAPRWEILPLDAVARPDSLVVRLASGPGFGDGRHPTTQLCLQAIAALAPRGRVWRLLDFGSGSGILSIAATRLGAIADAVEIDPHAIDHAAQNICANAVEERVRQLSDVTLAAGPFDLVVANILRSVLLDFAGPLVKHRAPGGSLVLSGLVSTDVPEVSARYAALLAGARPEVYECGDWRALVWRGEPPPRSP